MADPAAAPAPTDAIEREIVIAAPPEAVWPFWVDPARLVRWMGSEAEIDESVALIDQACATIEGRIKVPAAANG